MECNKIKSLLSEYLDKTLRNDLSRDIKEHLLSCKNCSNEFFLMKSIKGELAGLEKIKAPNYLLNRVNQAVASPSWFSKILDFIPGSGGLKVPMEFVTLATTVVLVFLIFTNIHVGNNENVMVTDSGGQKAVMGRESNGPVPLDFIPVVSTKSGTLPSENVISSNDSDRPDPFDMINKNMPLSHRDKLISDLREMVYLVGGEIVSREYGHDRAYIDSITVKIPSNSYNSFIRRAEEIGRFNPPAPSVSQQSPDPVLLCIRLNLSE
ncbi:MAG: zf-HC2 domain-containing protein [Desulfobacteraceae bacterium]|jgi:hypothetical protein